MDIQYTNWQAVFFDFLIAGLVILSIFRLLGYLLPVFLRRVKKSRPILRSLPVAEASVWVLYLSWYVFRFAEIRSVFTFVVIIILLVLLYWLSRYFVKDLVAGIVFRVSGRFREGEIIVYGDIHGRLRNFRLLSVEIETPEGQLVYISYSSLAEAPSVKRESTDQSTAFSFVLNTPDNKTREDTILEIRHFLVSLPWSSARKSPSVAIRKQESGQFEVEITVFPIEKAFGRRIEQLTITRFSPEK